MQNTQFKKISFLGIKRNVDFRNKGERKINKKRVKKLNQPSNKEFLLKKPELNDIIFKEKNSINFKEEESETAHFNDLENWNSINSISTSLNINENRVCERCGLENNIIIFNSFKSILEYLNKNKLMNLFKSSEKLSNIKYNKLRMICSDCLIKISKTQTELERFILSNKSENTFNNNDPFNNLYENSYLINIFNNKEKNNDKNKNKKLLSSLENISQGKSGYFVHSGKINNIKKKLINSDANNFSKISNNIKNISQNENINKLNSPFIPFLQNNANDFNNLNKYNSNVIFQNKFITNTELNNNSYINQNIPFQYYILNYPDFVQIPNLNQQLALIPAILNDTSNINEYQNLNNNIIIKTKYDLNQGEIYTRNNKIEGQEISNENNQIYKNNNNSSSIDKNSQISGIDKKINFSNNYITIPNNDFNETFLLVSNLYHKLLNIKIKNELNLDLEHKQNENLSSNFHNANDVNNKLFYKKSCANLNHFDINNNLSNDLKYNFKSVNNLTNIPSFNQFTNFTNAK